MNPIYENTTITKVNRIDSLQVLRSLAFFDVFIYHCGFRSLGSGVSLFLVLSGFLMFYSYQGRTLGTSFKESVSFSLSKMKKLYPLHLLMMLMDVAIMAITLIREFSVGKALIDVCKIALNITLLQAWVPQSDFYYSMNGVAWYLSVCLFVYACFPNVLRAVKKMSVKNTIILASGIYIVQIVLAYLSQFIKVSPYISDNFTKWLTYICPLFRLGDFVIGVCLCRVYISGAIKIHSSAADIFEILVVLLVVLNTIAANYLIDVPVAHWLKHTVMFTPSVICYVLMFVMNAGFISKTLTCKPLIYLGNISAYTFLIHQVIIRFIQKCFEIFIGYQNRYVIFVLSFVLTILCAELYKKIKDVFHI